ncbi:hypothetical protein ACFOX2_12010 [Corynebacterium marambiense]|uniref:hypothetical protein n=1 Tax=Corynebacterium marambiense TaxID=2765364 RepID=UPI0036206049
MPSSSATGRTAAFSTPLQAAMTAATSVVLTHTPAIFTCWSVRPSMTRPAPLS